MTKEIVDGIEVDFADLEAQYAVEMNENYETVVIIDNLPKIDKSKEDKLLAVLRKNVFSIVNATPLASSILMPRDEETGMSKGYMFVEFENATVAASVVQVANGYRLDKSHVLSAVLFSDFQRLVNMEGEYREPKIDAFEEREYLKSWLSDPYARDQFVTLAGTTVSVFWNTRAGQTPELAMTRPNWTDSFVQWSSRGSYLATVHTQGVMLWGGASFSRIGKFPHNGVKLVGFSHTESFMTTWSPVDEKNPTEGNLKVWDVHAGKLVRSFTVNDADVGGNTAATVIWPIIKFSHDDRFAARVHENGLYVYELPSFSLLDKKPIVIEGIKDFSWSPVDQSLVHWTVGTEDIPSRVSIISLPSRSLIRTKNLFNVISCKVYWQSKGEYLCVHVDRHSKNKKHTFSNLELFRLKDKGIPVDSLEFKEPLLTTFSWEPEGSRFLAAGTHEFKTLIYFYEMKAEENGLSIVKLLSKLERKQLNKFLWSPRGEFVMFMGTESTNSTLEFFNATDMTILSTKEHFLATDAAWDPSGRFVASWVSAWKQSSDHGFVIYDMRGEQLTRLNSSRMAYFGWRPRPRSLLSSAQQKEIKKNIKKYTVAFEEADLKELSLESSNTAMMKSRMISVWNEWRMHCRREYESRNAQRRAILGVEHDFGTESPATSQLEEWMEEVIEEIIELV